MPPVTWNQVATKDDLRSLDAALRSEIAAQGSELRGEVAALRGELRGEIARAMERQIRWMVTFNTALVALALTVAGLLF